MAVATEKNELRNWISSLSVKDVKYKKITSTIVTAHE